MSRPMRTLAALALSLGLAIPAPAVELKVSAAASLMDVLKELGASYEKTSGDTVVFNFGGSSTLARQIQEGAPADVFFSADEEKMDRLEHLGLVSPGTRTSLVGNTLVVVVGADRDSTIGSMTELADARFRAIAVADPETVPAGIYAKVYLKKIGLWSRVVDRLVPTENVRAALAAVESGNVEAGIVYKTDALVSRRVRIAWQVPRAETPWISYPVAILRTSAVPSAAHRFVAYLATESSLAVFRRYGFLASPARK